MATVSVLYISDAVVGPHLELLRRVCDPGSISRPHVTVRYFDKLKVPAAYRATRVTTIDLIEPGSFVSSGALGTPQNTVFIRCHSDDLLALEHKPHFPESELHVTVYDGQSPVFARALLRKLRQHQWRFRVRLPHGTALTTTSVRGRVQAGLEPREVGRDAAAAFHAITGETLTSEGLASLTQRRRLELVGQICTHLDGEVRGYPRLSAKPGDSASRDVAKAVSAPKTGVHLTPPELAKTIVDLAVKFLPKSDATIDFGDPAVGTGAFYAALREVVGVDKIRSAIGVDVNRGQVRVAKRRWAEKGMEVIHADYLHLELLPSRNLIIANPPYLRHQGIPRLYKERLNRRASLVSGIKISPRSGQYVYFLLLSHSWLAPKGIAAWLLPSEFMQAGYGAAVRRYLTEQVTLIRVHRFDHSSPLFENAEVLPAIVVFSNEQPPAGHRVTMSSGGVMSKPEVTESIPLGVLRESGQWRIPHRAAKSYDNVLSVGQLFTVMRGIATGANEFFILGADRAVELGIPRSMLTPLLPKARSLESVIVEADGMGRPRVKEQLFLLDCRIAEDEVRARFPKVAAYFDTGVTARLPSRYLLRRRRPWYKQEFRSPPPFLCTYMGRRIDGAPPIKFLWNKSRAIATNTYLLLYPNARLASELEKSGRKAQLFDLLKKAAASIGELSRVYAGGLHKVEPGDLRQLQIHEPPRWLISVTESSLGL